MPNIRPNIRPALRLVIALTAAGLIAACTVVSPITLIERAVEARSASDIITDNRIVLDANQAMAAIESISASTEIYEQRLLVTGILEEPADYQAFRADIEAIAGVKKLYWHVAQMSEAEREAAPGMISWTDAIELDIKAGISLIETKGIADVNFRVAVDSFGTVYLLGRARSQTEMDDAMAVIAATSGVGKIINYAVVRP